MDLTDLPNIGGAIVVVITVASVVVVPSSMVVVVVGLVASVVVDRVGGGTGPAAGQKSGEGSSLPAYLSSKDFKVRWSSVSMQQNIKER